jgi:hypothetical protein
MSQLRAIIEKPQGVTPDGPDAAKPAIDAATRLNKSITESMKAALSQIPSPVGKAPAAANGMPALGGSSRQNGKW